MPGWNYELIAIIAVVICVVIMLVQYIWLVILAYRQERQNRKYEKASKKIEEALNTIKYSPTKAAMENEIEELKKYVGRDSVKMELLSDKALFMLLDDNIDEQQKAKVVAVNNRIKPLDYYIRMLHYGNKYQKAYACRKVAVYCAESQLPVIREYSRSRNRVLAYNAAMALSSFGDEKSLAEIIKSYEKNYDYSFRIILELMDVYNGDLRSLATRVFKDCDDYIKVTVIKGLSDYMLSEFEDIYLDGLYSKNLNLKIACVRALGRIGKPEYEHRLITAAHDKNWVVRSAAVKGLVRMNTDRSKQALVEATTDPEWWVRYNAANSLVKIDSDLSYVQKVLEGYDKYGADAVKYMLYRYYDLQGA